MRTKKLWTAVSAAVLAGLSWVASADVILNTANGHYYERVRSSLLWDDAKVEAESRSYLGISGHLATITDAGESAFITAQISESGYGGYGWLGGFQLDGNSVDTGWVWVTGEPWVFTNWAPGEPNDSDGRNENRLCLWGNAEWNDGTDNAPLQSYIVEYDTASAVPLPSAAWAGMTLLGGLGLTHFVHRRTMTV